MSEERIKVKLIGENGNIFNLMGIVQRELRRHGQENKIDEMISKVKQSHSYAEALSVLSDYVDIE